jgi:hypothetical protein
LISFRVWGGLGHDGAFGYAGCGRRGGESGTQGVAGVVAGDARFRDQLFDHQGYGLGGQAGWVDTSVPVHGAEERSCGALEDLDPSFDRPYRAGGWRETIRNTDLSSLPFRIGF